MLKMANLILCTFYHKILKLYGDLGIKPTLKPGVVVHAYNPSTQEAKAEEMEFQASLDTLGLELLSQTTTTSKIKL
jgi:hypothetical protein